MLIVTSGKHKGGFIGKRERGVEDSMVGWEKKVMECGSCYRPIQIAFTIHCFNELNYLLFLYFLFALSLA